MLDSLHLGLQRSFLRSSTLTRFRWIVLFFIGIFTGVVGFYIDGISDLIIDPGFGFAKTLEQNYEVLSKLELFKQLDLPILTGVSRKSMIYKVLEITAQEALNGTSVIHTIALQKGANILRVHDVKEAVECVKLFTQFR